MEHAFGSRTRNFADLPVHGTAGEVLADWRAGRDSVTRWLNTAVDDDLREDRPSHLGGTKTAGEVMRILLDEQTHHGAEVALLRDLYARAR